METLRFAKQLLRDALRANPPLAWAIGWQFILLAISLISMPFDRRVILGINPWIKPAKFEVSVLIYLLTVAPMLYGLRWHPDPRGNGATGGGWRRSRYGLGLGFAVAMTIENTIIALQSYRGVPSHMNYTSLLNGVLFGVMGVFILVNTILLAILLVLWCTSRVRTPPALTNGIRLGLALLLIGSVEGTLMVRAGGHTVGAKDGLAGLPFLNWSTAHGDLRVPHFFAIHALQAMPLAGLLLARTRLPVRLQIAGVWLFALLYVSAVGWLFAEARGGRPFLGL